MDLTFVQLLAIISIGLCLICLIAHATIYKFRSRMSIFYMLLGVLIVVVLALVYDKAIMDIMSKVWIGVNPTDGVKGN